MDKVQPRPGQQGSSDESSQDVLPAPPTTTNFNSVVPASPTEVATVQSTSLLTITSSGSDCFAPYTSYISPNLSFVVVDASLAGSAVSTINLPGSGTADVSTGVSIISGSPVCGVFVNPGGSTTTNIPQVGANLPGIETPPDTSPTYTLSKTSLYSSDTTKTTVQAQDRPELPTTSSDLSLPSSPKASSSRSLDAGAIAGIVVGVVVAFGLIGIGYVLCRRGKGRHERKNTLMSGPKNPFNDPEASRVLNSDNLEGLKEPIPVIADDATITRELSTLFDQIELHIENFYLPSKVDIKAADPEFSSITTARFRILSNLSSDLIFKTENQLALVKCYLATVVVAALGYSSDPFFSLLPPQFESFPATIYSAEKKSWQGHEAEQASAQWRMLSRFLRPDMENDAAYVAERDRKISAIIKDFDTALAPWIHGRYSYEEKQQNLAGILVKASRVGMLLFSQPTPFSFDWTISSANSNNSRAVVITPSVSRGGREVQNTLPKKRVLIDARLAVV